MSTAPNNMSMYGVVTRFEYKGGYGFIRSDTGMNSIFFHASNFTGEPKIGLRVEFDLSDAPRGPKALNVRPVQ